MTDGSGYLVKFSLQKKGMYLLKKGELLIWF